MTSITMQSPTTRTSAGNGSPVDTSAAKTDWTLTLDISFLSAGAVARFAFVDADGLAGPTASIEGAIYEAKQFSWKRADFPNLALGGVGNTLQLNLAELVGMSPSISYSATLTF